MLKSRGGKWARTCAQVWVIVYELLLYKIMDPLFESINFINIIVNKIKIQKRGHYVRNIMGQRHNPYSDHRPV